MRWCLSSLPVKKRDEPKKTGQTHSNIQRNLGHGKQKVEKRKFKRYDYRPDCCPVLDCQNVQYKVLNISEGGLKIEIQSNTEMQSDVYIFNGYLRLSNGERIPVSGKQVWIIGDEIGIKLNVPISEKTIASEADNFQDTE